MSSTYRVVIPARMASERLPGKPLADIHGHPLIEHVFRQALKGRAETVVIATDDERIRRAAESFGARVVMTSDRHESGTDRLAECATAMGWPADSIVVNLQGDEPQMPPECLDQVAGLLASHPTAQAASLYWPMDEAAEIRDPNVVKVVTGEDGMALMFSRSVIPFPRNWQDLESALASGKRWKRHVGLYAYRVAALEAFARHPPCALEMAEKLEQLRILESGGNIVMARARRYIPPGVDTEQDLERVRREIM